MNVQAYLDMIHTPWGRLFYQMVWHHIECSGKKILDFGSGFGVTANHLAKENDVTAIEPNEKLLKHRVCAYTYHQIVGSIEALAAFPDASFDLIICHNVLEYIDDRTALLGEFRRLLKPDGVLSLVKHNRVGKIMQKAVFEYQLEEAAALLNHQNVTSANFGTINEYDEDALNAYCKGLFTIEKNYGVRTFYGLQRNELKNETDWLPKMFQLECMAEEVPDFRNIAFYHHYILKPDANVKFYKVSEIDDSLLKFAVIAAKYENKWVFCRHKARKTWEIPGGHREVGEAIDVTAHRELQEESGALNAELRPVAVYGVQKNNSETYGMLFFAKIHSLGKLSSETEIGEIMLSESMPSDLTYPAIQPHLFRYVCALEDTL